jgi:ABC-type multidrug transport system fused ATPase/permease subunit
VKGAVRRLRAFLGLDEMKAPARRLLPYVKRYRKLYAVLLMCMLFQTAYSLYFAWFLKEFADRLAAGEWNGFIGLFAAAAAMTGLKIAADRYEVTTQLQVVDRITLDLKNDVFGHMMRLPIAYFLGGHSGDNVSRLTNDIHRISGAVGKNLVNLVKQPLTAFAAFVFLLTLNAPLAFICFLAVPFALVLGAVFGKRMRANGRKMQHQMGVINSFLNDVFIGHTVVRAFRLERRMTVRYRELNEELLALEMQDTRLQSTLYSATGAVHSVSYLLCLGGGAWLIAGGSGVTLGTLLAFAALFQNVVQPVSGLAFQWGGLQSALAAADRVCSVLDEPPAQRPAPPAAVRSMPLPATGIRIEGVTFGYEPDRPLFQGLTLHIPAGRVTALVGPSGAGKSTLVQLILGFHRPEEGTIRFDGWPAELADPSAAADHIAVVPQETHLFTGTIADNIALGRPGASELEIIRAAKEAGAHEFITALPHGYRTEIGERGVRLSGGQKQRIAIARAILKNSPVLVLDEATSNLDTESEFAIKQAMARLMRGRTTVMIAHRLSTVRQADHIVVMDQGRIVEQGTHDALMQRRGLYARLVLKGGELDEKSV